MVDPPIVNKDRGIQTLSQRVQRTDTIIKYLGLG